MKLEVGMYVRTKYGIAKYIKDLVTRETIYRLIDKKIVYDNVEDWEDCLLDNEISKASYNIIDLIEVGDYVNGHRVLEIFKDRIKFGEDSLVLARKSNYDNYYLYIEEIKSIVTKEQFESMQYKVVE